ncbi:NAD(P)/FAD-dependent oxidoreductase [Amycolatopsis jejuensis]|uniref:NAD(P)/FAD-dependent oxidoreductase n=1 Tax=Amycolatopsis jejuensis TaxID=330084 RepID=UPI0007C46888|nr:FAD-dependent oxidoreductase [Amycolatopsis jejuensis]
MTAVAPVRRVVIAGAGQGGVHTAASLRRLGYDGDLTLVSAEPSLPYQRPPLSKTFLRDPDPAHIEFHDPAHYASLGIELVLGDPVSIVDRPAREIALGSGRVVPYDHLVLATGAHPRRITGLQCLRNVFHLHDRDSSVALGAQLREARSMLLVGGGFVGLEIASAAVDLGCAVTVVEQLPSILAHAVPPQVADFLYRRHRARGVRFHLQRSVSAFAVRGDRLDSVTTDDGTQIAADVVVVGIGSVPSTALAAQAGLPVDGGIVVDDRLRTEDPHVSAIGDGIRFPLDGAPVRLTSVQHAMDSARHAATQILGGDGAYRPVPWFWTDQAGVKVQMAGMPSAPHDRTEISTGPSGTFAVRHYQGDRFVGGATVGMPREHVAMRRDLAAVPAVP